MADRRRLLRIRRLQEQVIEEKLLEARTALERTTMLLDRLKTGLCDFQHERLQKLAKADAVGSSGEEQAWQRAKQSVGPLALRLEQQQEQAVEIAAAYAEAHRERMKLEVLLAADARTAQRREEYREQRRLDDAYLSGRREPNK